jgi:hypothetical protein
MKYIVPAIASIIVSLVTAFTTIRVAGSDIAKSQQKAVAAENTADAATKKANVAAEKADSAQQKAQNISDTSGLPVGSIVASMLGPKEFSDVAGDPNGPQPASSKWVPADGRSVSGSQYTRLLGRSSVPDLRGLFLRGLNAFDPSVPLRSSDQQDPDSNRKAGEYQADLFRSHQHDYSDHYVGGNGKDVQSGSSYPRPTLKEKTEMTGGEETRPKNAAVYYYIRIN